LIYCISIFSVFADEQSSKRIIIGGDYNYQPFEFIDKDGNNAGYNVELSQEIAEVMGLDIEIKLGQWADVRAQLDQGDIDILQGMAATKERTGLYEFSPHTFVDRSIFARDSSPMINSLSDLENHQVIVQKNGSVYDMLQQSDMNIKIITVDTHANALRLLSSGKHDYAMVSNLPGLYLSKTLGLSNIKPVLSIKMNTRYGYAVKKGNEELLSQFAQGLAILKNTGRQQVLYDKWFGALQRSPWTEFGLAAAVIAVVLLFISTGVVIWNNALRKKVESRTQELKAQQMQLLHADKMTSLGVLVSGVAHEINNPCGILTLNFPFVREVFEQTSEILDEYQEQQGNFTVAGIDYERLKEVFPDTLEDMHIASRKIRGIVEDLKHFALKDDASVDLTESLDLNSLVKVSMRLVANQIKNSTDNFEVNFSEDIPAFKGAGQRIEQVIINLILNACQALNDKNQPILVTTYFDVKRQHVVLTIIDHGVGIKESDLGKLTDPFYTSKRKEGGTGLGLSVSAGIIRDHQGLLKFSSTEGKGTKVKLSLPLSHKEPHQETHQESHQGTNKESHQEPHK